MRLRVLVCVYHLDTGLHQFFEDAIPDLQCDRQLVDSFHDFWSRCVILRDFCSASWLLSQITVPERTQSLKFLAMVWQPPCRYAGRCQIAPFRTAARTRSRFRTTDFSIPLVILVRVQAIFLHVAPDCFFGLVFVDFIWMACARIMQICFCFFVIEFCHG